MSEERVLYGKRESASLLSVSLRTLENLIAAKRIPVCRIGKRVLLSRETLTAFARQLEEEA